MTDTDIAFAVTSILAFIMAVAALLQAAVAAATNRARIFVEFSDRYTDDAMGVALGSLACWYHDKKLKKMQSEKDRQAVFKAWAEAKRKDEPGSGDLNKARRLVSRYYYDVAALYQLGLVRREFARALLSNNGLNIFYKVCDPMNRALQPLHRFEGYCASLRRLRNKFGDGEVYDSGGPQPEPDTFWISIVRFFGRFLPLRRD